MSFLYDPEGNRKYLTAAERSAFLLAAQSLGPPAKSFCRVLAFTGGRISEVLALTPARVDVGAQLIVLETLKKRRTGVFRAVPVPAMLLQELDRIHGIKSVQLDLKERDSRIWHFGRTTAWSIVKRAMTAASIDGPRGSPKGLRHAFAVSALQSGVPITLVRKWLGHSRITTTEIYADVVGDEEQQLASRLWRLMEAPYAGVEGKRYGSPT